MSGVATQLAAHFPAEALGRRRLPGGQECPSVAPRQVTELQEALGLARAAGWRCLVTGGGTRLGWQRPQPTDLVLETSSLTGEIAYEAGDGTVTAPAGTRLEPLARIVGEGGHHLTPEVAAPERSSLGGVLACGASGIDRLRLGPVRHNVLGMRVLLADGTLARTGGRLVKNVTGYDLQRLFCGAAGTLGIVIEATLRLYPAPRHRAGVRASFATHRAALDAARTLRAMSLEPYALFVRSEHLELWELDLLLGGREEVVAWELEQALPVLPRASVLEGDEERSLRVELRQASGALDVPVLEAHTRPSLVAALLDRALPAAREHGGTPHLLAQPGLGLVTLAFPAGLDPAAALELARALATAGAHLRWRNAPEEIWNTHPATSLPAPARALVGRLKHALDPSGLFGTQLPDDAGPPPASHAGR